MRTLTPNIWFAGDAEDGAALYARALPATRITRTDRYPTEGLLPFQEPLAEDSIEIREDVTRQDREIRLVVAGLHRHGEAG